MYNFIKTSSTDYKIFFNEEEIGVLLLTINPTNIFIRQIRIYNHAHRIVELLIEKSPKPVRYSISTHSLSAIKFWENFNQDYQKYCTHIKGDLYEINIRD